MPLSAGFGSRLLPVLPDLVAAYGTPFHIYDAAGIVATHRSMVDAFDGAAYRQYFAVKALPNPTILALLHSAGSGLDCASAVELDLADRVGATGQDIVFTSNNTPMPEYRAALKSGALVTFDDRTMLDKVDALPEIVAFRVSPHGLSAGSTLMGSVAGSKFGVPVGDLPDAYRAARNRGATRFGFHGMICANELDQRRATGAAVDVVRLAARVADAAGTRMEYVNIGGGLGIPYRPTETPIDFRGYAEAIVRAVRESFARHPPRIVTELGRFVTGPHGALVTRVINVCRKGRSVVGVDASMSALMRPALYSAYHHLTLPFARDRPERPFDVVGSLCENWDRFAVDRMLPTPLDGDIAVIHDTGAHGHAMGFTYNGRLRPAELMMDAAGGIVEIRRAETVEDYLATAHPVPKPVLAAASGISR